MAQVAHDPSLSRRQALRLGILAGSGMLAASVLAACGGGGTAASPTTGTAATAAPSATKPAVTIKGTKVSFWYNYTGNNEKVMTGIIDKFNQSQSDYTIVGESKKTYDDLYKANLAAIQAGQPTSFSIAYENQVAQYQQSNVVIPFDDMINNAQYGLSADDKADIFAPFLDIGKFPQFSNKQLTFPAGKSLEVMWYNADALKKAGFDQPPATWDDFKSQVGKVTTADAIGFTIKPDGSRFSTWVFSRGGNLISSDGSKLTINTPEAQASMQLIADLNKAKQLKLVAPTGFDDENLFAASKAIFWQESTSSRGFIDGAIKQQNGQTFNWQDATVPVGKAGDPPRSDLYGGNFTIFKTNAQQQLGAWQFIKFFASRDNTVAWALATGYMPLRKSAADTPDYKKFLDANPRNGLAFKHLGDQNLGEPKIAAWQQVRDILQAMIQDVVNNSADPKQALADADKKANTALQQS